jgi:hypothetical protein
MSTGPPTQDHKTWFGTVIFLVFILNYIKINSRIEIFISRTVIDNVRLIINMLKLFFQIINIQDILRAPTIEEMKDVYPFLYKPNVVEGETGGEMF